MERCYYLRRTFAVALALVVVASAATAAAQYMYLDANGDGVHSSADVVPPTGTVTLDVWLKTDQNRDGSPAVCAQDGTAPSLRGYGVLLGIANGAVAWSGVSNRLPNAALIAGPTSSETELYVEATGSRFLAPGSYRLVSVTATTVRGTPSVGLLEITATLPHGITLFESDCPGVGFGYSLILGEDWSDVDGLPFGGQENRAPILDPIAPMTVAEGATDVQALIAHDADGGPVVFSKVSGPGYMSVSTTDPGNGTATGALSLQPGYFDAGSATGTVRVSDGVLRDDGQVVITVRNVNRPFTWTPPYDMEIEAGDIADQALNASDPDGGLQFSVAGPDYAWITVVAGSTVIRLEPPLTSGGVQLVTVTATDGEFTETHSFQVTINHSSYPASLQAGSPMTVVEGGYAEQTLRASDPDGDRITFSLNAAPGFAKLRVIESAPGEAVARIELRPARGDEGSFQAVVHATDGSFLERTTVPIRVLGTFPGDTRLLLEGEPGEYMTGGKTLYVGKADATFRVGNSAAGGVVVDVIVQAVNRSPSPDVLLAAAPASRADCASPVVGLWSLRFQPPSGQALAVGTYRVAGSTGGDSTAGLLVAQSCPSCAPSEGTLEVRQILRDEAGVITSFWSSFDVVCSKRLHGEIRYNAMPSVAVSAPARRTAYAGGFVSFEVAGETTPGLGPVSMSGTNLPAGATLTPSGPSRSIFVWSPRFDQIGNHALGFRGTNAAGDTGSTFTLLTVEAKDAVTATMDVNRLVLTTTNHGSLIEGRRYSAAGALHPLTSGYPVAASAALWVAGRVSGTVRTALGGVDSQFAPGPLVDGAAPPFDARFKNYSVDRGVSFGTDRSYWPVDQGAPLDGGGAPLVLGDRLTWSVYNAADPVRNPPPPGANPLAVEVKQLTWASGAPAPLQDVVFMRFQIRNGGAERLEDGYVGLAVQPTTWDLAGHVGFTLRDLAGFDSTLGLGYAYSSGQVPAPNAFGALLLRGPVSAGTQGGVTAFTVRTHGGIAAAVAYDLLRGLKPDGSAWHEFDDPGRPITQFVYTGDPFRGTGWLAPQRLFGDGDFVLSSGPFTLEPGATQEVDVAWIASISFDRLDAVARLKESARAIRASIPPALANHPPAFAIADTLRLRVDTPSSFSLEAVDVDGDSVYFSAFSLPPGARLTQDESVRARITWTPTSEQTGSWRATLVAVDSRGGSARALVIFVVSGEGQPPTADAGGPYTGLTNVPIQFSSSGSVDPDGEPLEFRWSFGDGASDLGPTVEHAYSTPGGYAVTLLASDGRSQDEDSTTAEVLSPASARAFLPASNSVIRPGSGRPLVWICLEPIGMSYANTDLDPATIRATRVGDGTSEYAGAVTDQIRSGDEDRNGIEELRIPFRSDDVRRVLGEVPRGRSLATLRLSARMAGWKLAASDLEVQVDGGHGVHSVRVTPNPLNPEAVITFQTAKPGSLRLLLYDATGRLVRVLADEASVPPGFHQVAFDGRGGTGRRLVSGVYFYRLESAEGSTSGRLTILK